MLDSIPNFYPLFFKQKDSCQSPKSFSSLNELPSDTDKVGQCAVEMMQKFYKNGWPDRRKTVSFSIEIL